LKTRSNHFYGSNARDAIAMRLCRNSHASEKLRRRNVEIVEDLAAIRRRIDELSSGPTARGTFDGLVAAAVARSNAVNAPESACVPRSEIDRLVEINARRYNVDPKLIEAIIANESGFDSNATSSVGARGLMQLMPETAVGLGVSDAYDAAQNVRAGTRYLRKLLDQFGSTELAVAAYNAGPDAVRKYGGVPPYAETQGYVRSVLTTLGGRSQLGNSATNAGSQRFGNIEP
jgi:soluble lytic murein transglycosylase-like protein